MRRMVMIYLPMCVALSQAQAQTIKSPQTNRIDQAEVQSTVIQHGDSLDHVLNELGEPRVDCPLKGGKRILIYEKGEIHLLNGKVTSCDMLTEEQLADKRARERRKKQRSSSGGLNRNTTRDASRSVTPRQKENTLLKTASDLQRKVVNAEKVAPRRMTNVIEIYNLMVLKGGKSRQRYEKDLLERMPNNTLEEFYNIDFNFAYFERQYDNNPSALLTLNSLYKEHSFFIQEYEQLQEYQKQLSQVRAELKMIETIIARDRRREH